MATARGCCGLRPLPQVNFSGPGPFPVATNLTSVALLGAALTVVAGFAGIVAYWRRLRPNRHPPFAVIGLLLGAALAATASMVSGHWTQMGLALAWIAVGLLAAGVVWLWRLLPGFVAAPDADKLQKALAEQTRLAAVADAARQTAEEMFRTFMDNGPLRCWVVDAAGVYQFANRAYEQAFDLPGGLRGRRLSEVFSAGLAEKFMESDQAVLRHGRAFRAPELIRVGPVEYEVYKFPVRGADGAPLVAGIALDVTDSRTMQAALRRNSELLSLVTEAMRVYLENGDWKTAHGLLLRCALRQSQSERGFVGVMVEGPKLRILAQEGVRWEDFFGGEAAEQAARDQRERDYLEFSQFDNLLGRVITTGEVVIENGFQGHGLIQSDGKSGLSHGFIGVPVRRGQQVVGLIAVALRPGGYDSSSQAQLETLVQQAGVLCDSYRRGLRETSLEDQLRVSQKMEAVGLLAGGVAHDFNNLLQVIKGYTAFALEASTPWEERRASLEQVRGAADRAAQLTQQLLAFGRQQTLQKGDLDLNVAITDLLRMIRRVIGEQITIAFAPGHALGNVRADRAQIDQVLLNLCLNARDALPAGGRITIEAENVLVSSTFRESHPWAKPGRYVLVTVSDNGVGMTKETAARIFEPFFTTKPKDKGTGLGLSVVYGVVKQHDGMIQVYSEPGKGTTFKIYLPIVANAFTESSSKASPLHPRGTETILLAEDEPLVRELARRILSRSGYTVLMANDGVEACALFALHGPEISLVILDVVMPQLGGPEAYERMVAARPALPVIFCSGYAGSALEAKIISAPGSRLLAKPYGADEMLAAVRAALDLEVS
jgi:PAS domain S-box-containing protein